MSLIVTCRTCGRDYEPDRAAIIAGLWRDCPECRPPPDTPKPNREPDTDTQGSNR